MSAEQFAASVMEQAAFCPVKTWLVILPASGTVRRHKGKLVAVDMGGESNTTPILVIEGAIMAVDPRALIVDQQTLDIHWQPRQRIYEIHPAAAKWLRDNPDVFNPETRSGITPILGEPEAN